MCDMHMVSRNPHTAECMRWIVENLFSGGWSGTGLVGGVSATRATLRRHGHDRVPSVLITTDEHVFEQIERDREGGRRRLLDGLG